LLPLIIIIIVECKAMLAEVDSFAFLQLSGWFSGALLRIAAAASSAPLLNSLRARVCPHNVPGHMRARIY
jgi:hypothetical protein